MITNETAKLNHVSRAVHVAADMSDYEYFFPNSSRHDQFSLITVEAFGWDGKWLSFATEDSQSPRIISELTNQLHRRVAAR